MSRRNRRLLYSSDVARDIFKIGLYLCALIAVHYTFLHHGCREPCALNEAHFESQGEGFSKLERRCDPPSLLGCSRAHVSKAPIMSSIV